MCSPIPEVYNHREINRNIKHRHAVDEVINKLYYPMTEFELGEIKSSFWSGFYQFSRKTGEFATDYWWNSHYLMTGESYKWHQEFSANGAPVFANVACHVSSKILGIGSAERAWGAVKHLKTDKQAHLSAKKNQEAV